MIKFGMSVVEMIAQLTRGFTKQTGRIPSGLEKIKIQQEAIQRAKDMNKVLDMKGNPIDPTKPIMGGEQSKNLSGEITSVPNRPGQSGLSYETRNKEAIQRLKDKMKKDPPEELAYGGVAGLLGERTGFRGGGSDASKSDFGKSSSKSKSSTNQGPAGGASAGGNYGGNKNPQQTYGGGGGGPPGTNTGGGGGPPGTNTGGGGPSTTTPTFTADTNLQKLIEKRKTINFLKNLEEEEALATGIGPLSGILKGGKSIFKNVKGGVTKKGKLGVTYQDPTKNFTITQDIVDMIKDQKLDPKLKFQGGDNLKKGGNFFYEGTLDKNLNPEARIGIKMPFNFGKTIRKKSINNSKEVPKFNLGDLTGITSQAPTDMLMADALTTPTEGKLGLNLMDYGTLKNSGYSDGQIEELQLNPKIDTQEVIREIKGPIFAAADGGIARAPFAGGGMGRRGFLKLLAGAGAGITALKSGFIGMGKKAAPIKKVAETAAGSGNPPAYFFKLVEKIKLLGDDAPGLATLDRQNVKKYKDYELTEDISTGEIQIMKSGQTDEAIDRFASENATEEVFMRYKPSEKILLDEANPGGGVRKTLPEFEANTSYTSNNRGNTGEILDSMDGVTKEVVEDAMEEALKPGFNQGGRAGYAKGKGVMTLLDLVKKKFGRDSITTADKIATPQKTLDRDMFKKFDNRNPDPKRQMTSDELEDFEMEIGPDQLEGYDFDGTVGDAQRILKEDKAYEAEMYQQYKMGKLDPVAGDKSPARKRFLEKKMEESLMSGDSKLMTREEIDELYNFDLGTEMDNSKLSVNDEIKQGVAEIMSDTSSAALQKSIEIDNLMLKYPGMNKNLAEQIATEINPRKKADIIAMVEQTFKMSEKGMSGADIIQTFKNTTRTKQASGGIAHMLGE